MWLCASEIKPREGCIGLPGSNTPILKRIIEEYSPKWDVIYVSFSYSYEISVGIFFLLTVVKWTCDVDVEETVGPTSLNWAWINFMGEGVP